MFTRKTGEHVTIDITLIIIVWLIIHLSTVEFILDCLVLWKDLLDNYTWISLASIMNNQHQYDTRLVGFKRVGKYSCLLDGRSRSALDRGGIWSSLIKMGYPGGNVSYSRMGMGYGTIGYGCMKILGLMWLGLMVVLVPCCLWPVANTGLVPGGRREPDPYICRAAPRWGGAVVIIWSGSSSVHRAGMKFF